jgi:hypothetical protein
MMLLGHGTVYGAQYYTVAPPMGGTPWRDMEAWCQHWQYLVSLAMPGSLAGIQRTLVCQQQQVLVP